MNKVYLRTRPTAKMIGSSDGYLHNMRYLHKKGLWKAPFLTYIRRGRTILYDLDDIHDFMQNQKVGSIDE